MFLLSSGLSRLTRQSKRNNQELNNVDIFFTVIIPIFQAFRMKFLFLL